MLQLGSVERSLQLEWSRQSFCGSCLHGELRRFVPARRASAVRAYTGATSAAATSSSFLLLQLVPFSVPECLPASNTGKPHIFVNDFHSCNSSGDSKLVCVGTHLRRKQVCIRLIPDDNPHKYISRSLLIIDF